MTINLESIKTEQKSLLAFARRSAKRRGDGPINPERYEVTISAGVVYLQLWYLKRSGGLGCATHSFGPIAASF